MSQPRVQIVVLNWNNAADTLECLNSLLKIDYTNYQIVVCDNGSTDGSVGALQAWGRGIGSIGDSPSDAGAVTTHPSPPNPYPPVRTQPSAPNPYPPFAELDRAAAESGGTVASRNARIVLVHNGGNLGYAGGNNVGLRHAIASGADAVCLLNNDTVVSRDWLTRLVATLESDRSIGAVGAMLFEYYEPELVESAGGGVVRAWQGMPRGTTATRQRRGTPASVPQRLDFLSGACMLMPTSLLEKVGLIDEDYFLYCEDIDLSLRVRRAGFRIALAKDAEVWHKDGGTTRKQGARRDYYIVRNSLLLVHKQFPIWLPAAFAFSCYRCLLPKLLRGDWARLRAVTVAYRDFFSFLRGDAGAAGVGRYMTGPRA